MLWNKHITVKHKRYCATKIISINLFSRRKISKVQWIESGRGWDLRSCALYDGPGAFLWAGPGHRSQGASPACTWVKRSSGQGAWSENAWDEYCCACESPSLLSPSEGTTWNGWGRRRIAKSPSDVRACGELRCKALQGTGGLQSKIASKSHL